MSLSSFNYKHEKFSYINRTGGGVGVGLLQKAEMIASEAL